MQRRLWRAGDDGGSLTGDSQRQGDGVAAVVTVGIAGGNEKLRWLLEFAVEDRGDHCLRLPEQGWLNTGAAAVCADRIDGSGSRGLVCDDRRWSGCAATPVVNKGWAPWL